MPEPIPALPRSRGDKLAPQRITAIPRTPAIPHPAAAILARSIRQPAPLRAALAKLLTRRVPQACQAREPGEAHSQAPLQIRLAHGDTTARARPRAVIRRPAPRRPTVTRQATMPQAAAVIHRAAIHRAAIRRAARLRTICRRIRSAAIPRILSPIQTDTAAGRRIRAQAHRATVAPPPGMTLQPVAAAMIAPAPPRLAPALATETLRRALPVCRGPIRRRAVTRRPVAVTHRRREAVTVRQAPRCPPPAAVVTHRRLPATRRQARARADQATPLRRVRAFRLRAQIAIHLWAPALQTRRPIGLAAPASIARKAPRLERFLLRPEQPPASLRPAMRRRSAAATRRQPAVVIRHPLAITHRPLTITRRRRAVARCQPTTTRHRPEAATRPRPAAIRRRPAVLACRLCGKTWHNVPPQTGTLVGEPWLGSNKTIIPARLQGRARG